MEAQGGEGRVQAACDDLFTAATLRDRALRKQLQNGLSELITLANDLVREACKSQSTSRKRKLKSVNEEDPTDNVSKKKHSSEKRLLDPAENTQIESVECSDRIITLIGAVSTSTLPEDKPKPSTGTLREDPRLKKKNLSQNPVAMKVENDDSDITEPLHDNPPNTNKTITIDNSENHNAANDDDDVIIMPPPVIVPIKNKKKKTIKSEISTSFEEIIDSDESTCRRSRRAKKINPPIVESARSTRSSTRSTRASSRHVSPAAEITPNPVTKSRKTKKRKSMDNDSGDDVIDSTGEHSENDETKTHEVSIEESKTGKSKGSEATKDNARPKRARKANPKYEDSDKVKDVSSKDSVVNKTHNSNETGNLEKSVTSEIEESKKDEVKSNDEEEFKETVPIQHEEKVNKSSIDSYKSASDKIELENQELPMPETNDVPVREECNPKPMDAESPSKELKDQRVALNATFVINEQSAEIPAPKVAETVVAQNFNETVVLSSKNENQEVHYDPSASLLSDEINEVAETPPKHNIPLTSTFIINNTDKVILVEESPVKKKVKHFEKLAEQIKINTENHDVPTRITRNKVRPNYVEANENESKDKTKAALIKNKPPIGIVKKVIAKCAIPVAFKPVGNATKNLHNNVNDNILSPRLNLQAKPSSSDREEVIQKRIASIQAKADEQKRKREEKCHAAALARKVQEISKQAQLERAEKEKEEKVRQLLQEREEKLREEVEKKKQAQEKKAAENERRMQAAKQKQLEIERAQKKLRILSENETKFNAMTSNAREIFNAMIEQDEELENSNDKSDKERKQIEEDRKPSWAKKEFLDKLCACQKYLRPNLIDRLYSAAKCTPDLAEIFPNIDRGKLKRTSSAVWKTPPRYSMMPLNFM